MAYDDLSAPIPPRHEIPHYHGDALRALFVVEAVLLIIAQVMAALPSISVGVTIVAAIALVVVAGIMNPRQMWIHWVAALLAALGAALFGSAAYGALRTGSALGPSLVFILTLAILSLVALYLATRTIRGMMLNASRL